MNKAKEMAGDVLSTAHDSEGGEEAALSPSPPTHGSADFAMEIAGDVIRWMVARDPLKAAAFAIGEYSLADAIRRSIARLNEAESIRLQAEPNVRSERR